MRIVTFNCNSVRSRLPIILDWLAANEPDVLALQETKVTDEQFPVEAFTLSNGSGKSRRAMGRSMHLERSGWLSLTPSNNVASPSLVVVKIQTT